MTPMTVDPASDGEVEALRRIKRALSQLVGRHGNFCAYAGQPSEAYGAFVTGAQDLWDAARIALGHDTTGAAERIVSLTDRLTTSEETARAATERAVKAERERDEIIAALGGVDPVHWGNAAQKAQALIIAAEDGETTITDLTRKLEAAAAALEPFAGVDFFTRDDPDERVVSIGRWDRRGTLPRFYADVQITVADIRRARSTLAALEQKETEHG